MAKQWWPVLCGSDNAVKVRGEEFLVRALGKPEVEGLKMRLEFLTGGAGQGMRFLVVARLKLAA